MNLAILVLSFVCGLVIGSFLNVVIWRVPRGESIVRPRSRCPVCESPIRPQDEIPVLSWLLLRGHCRDCSARISARYPAVELATGLLFAAMALRFSSATAAESWRVLPAYLYLAGLCVALALIDADTRRLPNSLTLPGYVVAPLLLAPALALGAPAERALTALGGMALMFGVYFALWFAYPKGMGFGDVKLSGVLGLYLGWLGWATVGVGILLGWFLGGIVGVVLMASGKAGRKTAIAFGPIMIVGALAAVLVGRPIARGWLP